MKEYRSQESESRMFFEIQVVSLTILTPGCRIQFVIIYENLKLFINIFVVLEFLKSNISIGADYILIAIGIAPVLECNCCF